MGDNLSTLGLRPWFGWLDAQIPARNGTGQLRRKTFGENERGQTCPQKVKIAVS